MGMHVRWGASCTCNATVESSILSISTKQFYYVIERIYLMADQASIFNNGAPTQGTQQSGDGTPGNANSNDTLATLLGSIKNERGEPKYRTLEDAINALKHSQEYIPTLKQTKEELEQKLNDLMPQVNKVAELERVVQELTQRKPEPATPGAPGLNEEQVAELVSRTLTRQQQQAVQTTNIQTVTTTVKSKFGDKAEEVFYGKARELGMSNDDFNALAARTPKAVLKLLGIDEQDKGSPAPTRQSTSFNTEGFTPTVDSKIGRNTNKALIGATSQDIMIEHNNAKSMVEELAAQGLSISDLTNPKVYNKFFARK